MRTHLLHATILLAVASAFPASVRAHDPGLSSITLRRLPQALEFRVVVQHADLPEARRASAPSCSAADVLQVDLDGRSLQIERGASCKLVDLDYTAFEGAFALPHAGELSVRLGLFDELPRGHHSFARVLDAQDHSIAQRVLEQAGPPLRIHVDRRARTSWDFFTLGIEHILRGADHLLFLGVLLLGVESLRRMAALVSCFTLAHSLSLALAAFGVVWLSARIVESSIAASIVLVAQRNLIARAPQSERLIATFGFGLIHGLGFAAGLRELGVGGSSLAIVQPLLHFNLGVEVGQLGAGALALPCLFWLRGTRWPRVLSGLAVLIGAIWFVKRAMF
jgi:hypothetical protein